MNASDTVLATVAADTRLAIQPVILAGGSGTRLWPMSREHFPKQLIGLIGEQSLLQATANRLDGLGSVSAEKTLRVADAIIVCNEEHRFTTAEQLRGQGRRARLVLEPVPRNTAPALTAAAIHALRAGEDAVLVVMPADHVVANQDEFHRAIATGAQCAEQGAIVTLSVVPSHAETGYGYIKSGEALPCGAWKLERFVEKPHLELARQYLESGEYGWNAGIFIVRASTWVAAIEHYQPAMHAACVAAFDKGSDDGEFFRLDRDSFAASPSDSIDYAVMEQLAGERATEAFTGAVVPLDAGWSDVGSWDAIWNILPKDDSSNVARGRVMFQGASSTYAHSEGRLIACVGTQNLVVVETADAILVADKSCAQDVKAIVGRIKSERGTEAADHRKVHRPWGHYDSVDQGDRFQVKRIVVKPGARLSLQMHHHRAEHWVVVRGTALVTRGTETFILAENESTYIPIGIQHRLENPGKMPLEIIEVQSGTYLGEDDIVRFEDTYGRN
ncbi:MULTISPECIES: mannose-1-phosphate guanylyltransferase/mannose-6-phosphate isomerase [unclassified Caballeronia]|jgi:mannose-1-phosphate guanylyltransferase/mannose-6-phosphate isomerase|uniref:mannose-1-phosphate guanylyltransferase/mannose-6-phosphate isomerase n=1 Tax=unclassified Caballeronia TaxID=2646786 RepID=UPI00285DAABA|nr:MULTISPECIES: mannose-1-phosphate guanylyltransferase/mannose-6-phosphate isomerase [unclassified Caballeronia]MDR5774789.1 mannose-1-phosphate guanylyltransferase/mannose-6-phosphate isomerase [Caballeronia sp. LZ002]MDR5799603.1 mannose-1-phosphate guanylyltransferase/mannose-6-phosphate isomerase [Caballeronia sp. LZ001]MDR5850225.1 mannose-1-phosphate guanylyltransferase/mannose-6-phosphate isomerase [Caballeronia sp. LZ003]